MNAQTAPTALTATPPVDRVLTALLEVWPDHLPYLVQRFAGASEEHLATCAVIAERIWRIIEDDPASALRNYRWTCDLMLREEYEFRLTGHYRHSSFDQVRALVYDDPDFMSRYTDGLLVSQLLWANHTRALAVYRDHFLSRLDRRAELLEVGPGHGLLVGLAAEALDRSVTGWDVSDTSLRRTRRALSAMGCPDVRLIRHDLLDAPPGQAFDAVVASELLEHLEEPDRALRILRDLTRPGGLLFLNIPVNSPAPDHLALWRTPEEVEDFVRAADLRVELSTAFPMTGKTEDEARAGALTMSCVMVCRRPAEEERHD